MRSRAESAHWRANDYNISTTSPVKPLTGMRQEGASTGLCMLRYLQAVWHYSRIFSTIESARAYRKLRKGEVVSKSLAIRPLGGHRIHCRPGTTDAEVLWDTFHCQYHLPTRDLSPKTIVDLGSNIGLTIAHYAVLYPEARILGIELDKGNHKVAIQNIDAWKNRCRVIHGAVWTDDGEISYRGDSEWGFHVHSRGHERVQALSMNSIVNQLNSQCVDFVKMDVEGAEADLLARAADWGHLVRTLKVEIHGSYTTGDCITDLTAAGFICKEDAAHPTCIYAVRHL